MKRSIFFIWIFLLAGTAWAQIIKPSGYSQMAKKGDVILVGKIKSVSSVVHKNKLSSQTNEASPSLPNPDEYMIGSEYLVEVSDWIKGKPTDNKSGEIRILLLGRVPGHDDPILIKDTQYLLFLKPAVIDKPFEDAVVLEFGAPGSVNIVEFKPENYYSVYGGWAGAITGEKKIKEVRRKIKE